MFVWAEVVERWKVLAGWARAAVVAVLCVLFALVGLALALPPLVRRAVVERASERGLTSEVGRVRLGWGRIWLLDLVVRDPAAPGMSAHFAVVTLAPQIRGGIAVRADGATIHLVGPEGRLAERLRAWRGPGARGRSGGGSGGHREVDVRGVALRWLRDESHAVYAWGVRVSQERSGAAELSADRVRLSAAGVGGELRGLRASLESVDGVRKVSRLEAAQVAWRVDLRKEEASGDDQEEDAGRPSLGRPVRAAAARRGRGGAIGKRDPQRGGSGGSGASGGGGSGSWSGRDTDRSKAEARASADGNAMPAADSVGADGAVHKDNFWVSRMSALRSEFEQRTSVGFRGSVVALSVETRRGEESLRIGPSRMALTRTGGSVSGEIVPHASGTVAGTALTLSARAPLVGGAAEFNVSGGPVNLATLGVREGDFGLVGVREARLEAEAHLVVPFDGSPLSVVSKGALESARLRRPALAPAELSGIRMGWRLDASVAGGGSEWAVRSAELSFGDVRLELSGELRRGAERASADLQANVPVSSCSALVAAVPRGMAPLLEGVRLDGTFALNAGLVYDSDKPLETKVRLQVRNQCRVAEVPAAINPRRFMNPWQREVEGADGSPMTIESGPGTPDWTPYEGISPFMETAVVVCEDGGFFGHRGIDYQAIESSIRQNLEVGRFFRGGSTVSMQLAKNLYLSKEKTLSRKLQEAVLTLLLEQQLSKHQLMELYLNVIEFGPGIYGIRQAAQYYFNEEPGALSLGQALFLGSILPAPDQVHFRPDGHLKDHWAAYLRRLMYIAHKIRRITDEELAAGLSEEVIFREPSQVASEVPPVEEFESDENESEP